MEKISTIQKRNNLNMIYRADEPGAGGAYHRYVIDRVERPSGKSNETATLTSIQFQHGARNEEGSIDGVLDTDLLEIVRDRLKDFSRGEYSTRENALALTHVEEALLWLNKRTEERAERGVLGTNQR